MSQKKSNIMKYMTFCGGIKGDCASKSKKKKLYLFTKYIKRILWRVAVRLSYI